jgi:hypothetical protein|tara:strand:+ start:1506 stop:2744 length:1239 start_codon:yes stop_codon:yes gene_type:complete
MAGFDFKIKIKMKPKSIKSQVTIFMMLGIVILIVIGFVFYLSKNVVKKPAQQSIKKTQTTAIETQPIKEFVTSCVDKLSKDAIILLGEQGGYIYKKQGGTLTDFSDSQAGLFFIRNNKLNVAYNINKASLYAPPPYATNPPTYPWITFPYRTRVSSSKKFTGIFGLSSMPPLESSNGPHSIQTQIETFVDSNMEECLDFSFFEEQGFEITKATSKTNVIVGRKDVSVRSEIPLKVTNTISDETLDLKDFSTTLNIRLKDTYQYIQTLIRNDISDIKFDLGNPDNNKNSFFVRINHDAFSNDDLVTITDENSLIYGQPFQYIFARQNRIPALYYIKNPILRFPRDHVITENDLLGGSELDAEDPDEDQTPPTIQAQLSNPNLPTVLDKPQIKFRIEANDGQYSDHQIITVNRI